jgi:hypothetical protein
MTDKQRSVKARISQRRQRYKRNHIHWKDLWADGAGGWENIHALMNYDDKAVHEKLLNDRLATSFFTALVMTVAFAALLISPVRLHTHCMMYLPYRIVLQRALPRMIQPE